MRRVVVVLTPGVTVRSVGSGGDGVDDVLDRVSATVRSDGSSFPSVDVVVLAVHQRQLLHFNTRRRLLSRNPFVR